MKALTFLLKLQEPVLATHHHSGEANSKKSYPFIPGSMIRGALIRAYAPRDQDAMLHEKTRRLFFSDSVHFLHAYPAHPKTSFRMLPKPFSWFVEKDKQDEESITIYDFALKKSDDLVQPKSPLYEFCFCEDEYVHLQNATFQVMAHNASDNRNIKSKGESQIFRYEALAAGQEFVGVITAENDNDLSELKIILEKVTMTLGGAHTGGYGKVKIADIVQHDQWQEYQSGDFYFDEENEEDIVTITLLSDAIVRGEDGRFIMDIADALGIKISNNNNFQSFIKTCLVGGFNRKWGLPLPQSWALAAGSVFRCPADKVNMEKLKELVEKGIGERRNEGYGRLAVNWQTQAELTRIPLEKKPSSATITLSENSNELAEDMAKRLLINKLERELVKMLVSARDKIENLNSLPSSAQLSRVRVAARHALLTGNLNKIKEHMEFIKEHGAKEEWEKTQFDDDSFFEWVIKMSQLSKSDFEEKFNLKRNLPKIANKTASVDKDVCAIFIARYINGVMKLCVKENQKRKGREK